MKLSIIIPAYNEAPRIGEVIRRVIAVRLPANLTKEIVVVDDGSTDGSDAVLSRFRDDPQIVLIRYKRNMGKAAAVRAGSIQASGDIMLVQDADLELNPEEYPNLLEPILAEEASIVYGSRFLGRVENMSWVNRFANQFSTGVTNLLFRSKLTDMNTCYKVFKRHTLEGIEITSKHFAFDAEVTAKWLKQGFEITEVPINYMGRSHEEGKKMNWFRALQVLWGVVKYRFI
jgi:glycosyltransferase involved in cell wall biosynthesis